MKQSKRTIVSHTQIPHIKVLRRKSPVMSETRTMSLHTLPSKLMVRIFNHLDDFTLLCTIPNICNSINEVVSHYHRYQVRTVFFFIQFFTYSVQTLTTLPLTKKKLGLAELESLANALKKNRVNLDF